MSAAESSLREPRIGRVLLQELLAAIRNRNLYPPDHPEVVTPTERFVRGLNEVQEKDGATLAVIDGEAYLNGAPLREASVQYADFLRMLSETGVEVLHFAGDVRPSEVGALVEILSRAPEDIERAGGLSRVLELEGVSQIRAEALVRVRDRKFQVFEDHSLSAAPPAPGEPARELHPLEPSLAMQETYAGCVGRVHEAFSGATGSEKLSGGLLTSLAERLVNELLNDPGAFLGLLHIRTVGEDVFQHAVNVAILSVLLGSKLEMDEEQLRTLGIGALLHDVGELYVPRELRDKAGPLTDAEWQTVQEHPMRGAKLILGTGGLDPLVATIALEHHVAFQAGGYPKLVTRQRPHVCSRIVAIADAYDAITHPRPYQPQATTYLPPQRLLECAGSTFDPTLVKILLHSIGFYPPGTPVRLSDGRAAVVESHTPGQPFLPRVIVQEGEGFDVVDTAKLAGDGTPLLTVTGVLGHGEVPASMAVRRLQASA